MMGRAREGSQGILKSTRGLHRALCPLEGGGGHW